MGQCALEKERILITDAPGDYIRIGSGLGEGKPTSIVVLPVLFEGEVKAVIELASFGRFSDIHLTFLDQLTESMGIVLNTIAATMRTEELLKQSQALAQELGSRQEELTATNQRLEQQANTLRASEDLLKSQQQQLQIANTELEEKARLLAEQKTEVERKNREVEQAKQALEEKAEQLEITSKYKSEFLANMSHELRTPLNAIIGFSEVLLERMFGELNEKQDDYLRDIHTSGRHLLALINDILDLSKIEAGRMELELSEVDISAAVANALSLVRERATRHAIGLHLKLAPELGLRRADERKFKQILLNLLSNAVKFTPDGGQVEVRSLLREDDTLEVAVVDTGIGIAPEDQSAIFDEFKQVGRHYLSKHEGTGLGLALTKRFVELHGGTLRVVSAVGEGSTFTFTIPRQP